MASDGRNNTKRAIYGVCNIWIGAGDSYINCKVSQPSVRKVMETSNNKPKRLRIHARGSSDPASLATVLVCLVPCGAYRSRWPNGERIMASEGPRHFELWLISWMIYLVFESNLHLAFTALAPPLDQALRFVKFLRLNFASASS